MELMLTIIALTLTGIIINGVSVSIAAITSLDWKKQVTHDKAFEMQLLKCASQVSPLSSSFTLDTEIMRSDECNWWKDG